MNHIMELVTWALAFSKQNPLIAGGIGLWGVTVLTMLTRQVPAQIFKFLKQQFTVTLTVRSGEGEVFEPVLSWFESLPACRRFRTLSVQRKRHTPTNEEGESEVLDNKKRENILSVGEGRSYFFYGPRLFWVDRKVETRAGSSWGDVNEIITITSLGRSQLPIRRLIREIKATSEKAINKMTSIYAWDSGWSLFSRQMPRKLSSVFLPDNDYNRLLGHIQRFVDDRDYYLGRGIPYRLGILFYGVPGSGKTSTINALAAHFGRNVRSIDISNINNKELARALSVEVKDSVIVIEDINEHAGANSAKPAKNFAKGEPGKVSQGEISFAINKLTLSGLLCAIDGASSSDGRILIMTTNKDVATLPIELMRPGRVDLAIEFHPIGNEEAIRMIEYLLQDKSYRVPKGFRIRHGISAAQLQGLILAHRDCPQKVLAMVGGKS